MSETSKCREMQEHFPMLFNGRLNRTKTDQVRSHLKTCAGCRGMYKLEENLFRSAEAVAPMIVGEHPAGTTLEEFVNSADRLSSDEEEVVLNHLNSCQVCSDAVQNLRSLPAELDELVGAEKFSILAEQRADTSPVAPKAKITRIGNLWQSRPLYALAAAAMILIVAVYLFQGDRQVEMARVEVSFPSITRSAEPMILFETGSEDFVLSVRVHVGPETGHSYNLSLSNPISDSIVLSVESLVDFDSLGFAAFEQNLVPGRYELRLLDIERGDTIMISRSFEVRLTD